MARDLRRRAAAAPKRTTAVVDDSFIVAGAAWAGLTAALARNIVLVANHLRGPRRRRAEFLMAAAGAEAGRELAPLVGRRRGDGRDERLRALDGLGLYGLLRTVFLKYGPWSGGGISLRYENSNGSTLLKPASDTATIPFFYKYTR